MLTDVVFAPRTGRDLVDFARQAIEILRDNPWGVDQELFLSRMFDGNPPTDQQTRDFYWQEFKRAKAHSNEQFDLGEEGWVWIRARRGLYRGHYYYQAVAEIVNGETKIIIPFAASQILLEEKEPEWLTRTRSQMRIKVANVETKRRTGLESGNRKLVEEAERDLDDIFVFSTRLAAVYFNAGLTVANLRALAQDPKTPRVLHNSVIRALRACERYQREAKDLSTLLYRILALRHPGGSE
jgi:hypothetical protein